LSSVARLYPSSHDKTRHEQTLSPLSIPRCRFSGCPPFSFSLLFCTESFSPFASRR
jgi:hypothetical protein